MKKFLSGVLVGALLTISGTALAANAEKIEAYFRPDFQVSVNGQVQELKNAPVTVNGSMYLPLRELGNVLGYDVNWNDQTKTAELTERSNETQKTIAGDANMEFEMIENYFTHELVNGPAIKVGNEIFISAATASVKYDVMIRYELETDSLFFTKQGFRVVLSDTISDQVDAFYYAGGAYIKESLLVQKLQPAN